MQAEDKECGIGTVAGSEARDGGVVFLLREGDGLTYIEELQDVIRRLHGVEATHVKSVPVKETFRGTTVWEGIVEVFDLHGHPKAPRVYAWSHDADDPSQPRQHVTVLHIFPVMSAAMAVRAAIVQEFKSGESAEEA